MSACKQEVLLLRNCQSVPGFSFLKFGLLLLLILIFPEPLSPEPRIPKNYK